MLKRIGAACAVFLLLSACAAGAGGRVSGQPVSYRVVEECQPYTGANALMEWAKGLGEDIRHRRSATAEVDEYGYVYCSSRERASSGTKHKGWRQKW